MSGGMDQAGWSIGTLHQLIGHDAAAAVIGATAGDKDTCLLCQYERDPTDDRRKAVVRALAPTSIGAPAGHGSEEGQP